MATERVKEKLNYSSSIKTGKSGNYIPQSLAFISENNRVVVCSKGSGSNGHPSGFWKFSSTGIVNRISKGKYGHANGATYCDKNRLIYICSGSGNHSVWAVDPTTYNLKFTVSLTTSASGIAYDRVTNKFYVSSGNNIYVYPFSALSKGGKSSKYTSHFAKKWMSDGRYHQDVGGHNGVVMVCRSKLNGTTKAKQVSYIDCYDASNGKYLKSYYSDYGELESVAVDNNGYMHILFTVDRKLVKTTNKFSLVGKWGNKNAIASTITEIGSVVTSVTPGADGQKVVDKARSYIGEGGSIFWKYGGLAVGQPWCACFVWCIFDMCGFADYTAPKGMYSVTACKNHFKTNPDKFTKIYSISGGGSLSNALPGDIIIYTKPGRQEDDGSEHIGIVRETGTDDVIYTIEGNTTGGKVADRTRHRKAGNGENYSVQVIYRPPFQNIGGNATLFANPEKLYSSDNFTYIIQEEESKKNSTVEKSKNDIKSLISNAASNGISVVSDIAQNVNVITSGITPDDVNTRRKTKVDEEAFGPSLPVALDPVEAPFVELTIGGYTFGTYDKSKIQDQYPNYIDGLNVKRTNGSMNEYTINLVHQVRPGSNPNFIDELLSANGYEKIKIKYGDANSRVEFIDTNALLIGVDVSFDFVNCNIKYTIKATSSAASIASHKQTFASVEDKPSNIIRKLLYEDANEDLLTAFPAMRNRNFVEKNNLIPTTDMVISIDEYKDVNAISYLKALVAAMTSVASIATTSAYYLTMEDTYFKITEVVSGGYYYDKPLYEVDINFVDESQIYSFSADTNFSWPVAYEYSGNVSNYNYDITNDGMSRLYTTLSSNMLDFTGPSQVALNDNWWKQVTEFPITAKLQCRGLLSPLLLLTYIKVNCVYFGNHRITSGVYIVTAQEDTLNGSGYKSTLSLTRVSGPKQHIIIDGRVKT